MQWPELISFIRQTSPKYLSVDRGIDQRIISDVETRIQFSFPPAYRGFLLTIANDKNFNAFGRAVHDFEFLSLRHPNLSHYPEYFFRIAHDADNDLDNPIDLFIDLRIVTQYDTPLFEYEPYGPFAEDRVKKLQLSMMEYLTRQVVLRFRKFDASSYLCYYPSDFIHFLLERSFEYRLTPSANIYYLERDGEFILIEKDEQGAAFAFIQGDAVDVKKELASLMKKYLHKT